MRSFFGSILLILVLAALGATIYYHWSTNSHLEFELRNPDEPEKTTQIINMEKRAAALQAVPAGQTRASSRYSLQKVRAGTRGIVIPPVAAL